MAVDLSWTPPKSPADWQDKDDVKKHYAPIHPGTGTDQSAHAGVAVLTVPIKGLDNTMSALPKNTAKSIRSKTLEHLGTEEEIKGRFRAYLDAAGKRSPDFRQEAQFWYESKHDFLTNVATSRKVDPRATIGAAAAMSPGMEWEKNARQTEMLVDVHAKNPNIKKNVEDLAFLQAKLDDYAEKYSLDPVQLTSRTRFNTIEDPSLAAVTFYEISKQRGDPYPARYGYGPLSESIRILRGEDPNTVLTGMKRRSFFNNLLANSVDPDVTVDVQMLQAASGASFGDWRTNETESILIRAPSLSRKINGKTHKDSLGVRPLIADYVRDVTAEYNERSDDPWSGLLPRQTQAIIWVEWKEQFGRWGTERE